MINKKRRGTAVFFMFFFIIDYRECQEKRVCFFSSDYAFYKFNFIFIFFAAYFIPRSLPHILFNVLRLFIIYVPQKIYRKNFLKKYAKTLDKLVFTNYNMGEFSNQSKRVLTFKNKECQTFRTVSELRVLR